MFAISMVAVYQYPPNYAASLSDFGLKKAPIQTSAKLPPGKTLQDKRERHVQWRLCIRRSHDVQRALGRNATPFRFLEELTDCGSLYHLGVLGLWSRRLPPDKGSLPSIPLFKAFHAPDITFRPWGMLYTSLSP